MSSKNLIRNELIVGSIFGPVMLVWFLAIALLGLRGIGELQYQAQETRRSTLYALTTNDSNLQVEYADQSRAATVMNCPPREK